MIGRRDVLKLAGGLTGALLTTRYAKAAGWRVGVGKSANAYEAVSRAIDAAAEWPQAAISGRTVIIKPNLVGGRTADSGITTDAEAVRAVVDRALASGASQVLIVEGGNPAAPFNACGYDFFRTYDPGGRVALVDLTMQPLTLAPVPGNGIAYRRIYLPAIVADPNAVFISVGKLKTHSEVGVTLSTKNLFGLPPVRVYFLPDAPQYAPRYHLHDRGAHQSIVDLLSTRRVDFAVVEGIWGMEGDGPTLGMPIRADIAIAGRNAIAVDRVCLDVMQLSPDRAQYLTYASGIGLGPAALSQIEIAGDPYAYPRPFVAPQLPPMLWYPKAVPLVFSPASAQQTAIAFRLNTPGETRLEILKVTEASPQFNIVRTLRDWTPTAAGIVSAMWDGRDDAGVLAPPDFYLVRARARNHAGDDIIAVSSGGVFVSP
jgi:uncharacterized protein (DUF362 family)